MEKRATYRAAAATHAATPPVAPPEPTGPQLKFAQSEENALVVAPRCG